MGDWSRWALVIELWTAVSFACAFAWSFVFFEGVTEDAWQDARDEGPVDAECSPTVAQKGQRR